MNRNERPPIFKTRRRPTKTVTRACAYCGLPMDNLRPDSDKTEHGWCRGVNPPRGPRRAAIEPPSPTARLTALTGRAVPATPPPSRADLVARGGPIAVEAAPPSYPIASPTLELPIQPEGGIGMKQAKKKVAELQVRGSGGGPTRAQVLAEAEAFERMKEDADRLAGELEKRKAFLKEALLTHFPGMVIPSVLKPGQALDAVASTSELFDLEAARENGEEHGLTPKMLRTYTDASVSAHGEDAKKLADFAKKLGLQVHESLDLDAARNHLLDSQLKPFISIRTSFSIRYVKADGRKAVGDE